MEGDLVWEGKVAKKVEKWEKFERIVYSNKLKKEIYWCTFTSFC